MAETTAEAEPGERADIVIAGAGYVGLATAVAIKESAPHLNIVLVDAAPEGVWKKDGRASAIAAAAVRMLTRLGVWDAIKDEAQPITEMIVTDSPDRRCGAARLPHLRRRGEARRALRPHGAERGDERGARESAPTNSASPIRQGVAVSGLDRGMATVTVRLAGGGSIAARLLIASDGVKSKLRDMAGIKTRPLGLRPVGHRRDGRPRAPA